MNTSTIGIKELHTRLKTISEEAMRGQSFVVFKNSKPVFRIEPITQTTANKYTLKDLKTINFKGAKTLSREIDKITYNL